MNPLMLAIGIRSKRYSKGMCGVVCLKWRNFCWSQISVHKNCPLNQKFRAVDGSAFIFLRIRRVFLNAEQDRDPALQNCGNFEKNDV